MDISKLATGVFFFKGMDEGKLTQLLGQIQSEIREYSRGEVIFSPEEFEKKIGFVLSGCCEVVRLKPDGTSVPLNRLSELDSFGILALFSESERFPTSVVAVKSSSILFFTKADVLRLMEADPLVAMNIIEFLADRIGFLNRKIATLSNSSAEEKLSSFLFEKYEQYGKEFPINCKKAAEALSLGRASLYRALKQLEDEGTIHYDTKKIYINDPKGLERNTKK